MEVMGLRIATIILASLLILSLCARAPVISQSQEPIQAGVPIKISTDLVLVDALVTSQQTGRVINNLQVDDFQLYEDKIKQTITHFSQDRLPLALVLTFDVGGSLPEEMRLKKELLAALRGLKKEDEVAVMAFDFGRVRLIEDFSQDRELITDRVANIREEFQTKASLPPPKGVRVGMRPGSALNEAVYERPRISQCNFSSSANHKRRCWKRCSSRARQSTDLFSQDCRLSINPTWLPCLLALSLAAA
jgi:hypothetical protein